ncbi:partial Putative glycosyltransferase EpsE, partial [Patescibacteria group bacterium]
MPKVSIIFTSYNHDKYVCEAIDSILNQTFTDFELIIWDDASSDSSWHLISQYTDTRIKAFHNETNKGPVFAFNKTISEIATGDYIAIHHSDDVWEVDKLQKQVDFLNNHLEIGAVFSNAQAINENSLPLEDESHFYSNIFQQENKTRHEWLRFFFTQGNALCHPSVLIRKQCYQDCGLYRPMLAQVPDFDMWIRLCLKYEIYVLPEKLVRFRVLSAEANTSGSRPDTRVRGVYEYYKLLPNYQNINSIDELIKVFPSAEKYNRAENTNTQFALAMIALERMPFPFTPLFGLEILLDILSDDQQAAQIKQYYNFDYLDFIKLTSQYDIFSREELNKIRQELLEAVNKINQIENSLSWKVTEPLRSLVRSSCFVIFRKIIEQLFWNCRNSLILFKQLCRFGLNKLRVFLSKWRNLQSRYIKLDPVEKPEIFHVAPPNNYCFSVPFDYAIDSVFNPSIAVICHLYYDELLEEFKQYLGNIPFAFDLFITTDTLEKKDAISNGLKDWQKGNVDIRIAPNRGRDIAPKLVACHDVYENYEFFLHIHSKKSPHAEDVTAGWRHYLLDTL